MTDQQYKDYTIKARVSDFSELEQRIQSFPCTFEGIDRQTDIYFEVDKGKLKWRKGTVENLITHYERVHVAGAERSFVYRYDRNPSEEQVEELFANHDIVGTIRKERKIYRIENLKFHLDKLDDGQHFIELEAQDWENCISEEKLQAQCEAMVHKLGIPAEAIVPTGYLPNQN